MGVYPRLTGLEDISPSQLPTRYRVYKLLTEATHGIASCARRLKVTHQTVVQHARKLQGMGAITPQPGSKRPIFYQKGPNAAAFVHLIEAQVFDRPGSSGARVASLAERVHGDLYKFVVLGGPDNGEPEWRYVSTAKGVEQREHVVTVNGVDYTFRDFVGPQNRTIMLEPGSEYNLDPARAADVRERRRTMAELVGLSFARTWGFRFAPMVVRREPESGARADMRPFGNPNTDLVYADQSPATEGLAEIEWKAQAARAGATFLEQPRVNAETQDRLEKLERWTLAVHRELDVMQEAVLEAVRTTRVAVEAEAARQSPAGPAQREARAQPSLDPRDDPGVR